MKTYHRLYINQVIGLVVLSAVLDLLTERYGRIWCIHRRGSIIRITKRENIMRKLEALVGRVALPVDEVSLLPRRVVVLLKIFRWSIKDYLESLEPAELREIYKKVPTKPGILDLNERVITYIAEDKRWSKIKGIASLRPIVECLEASRRLLGELAICNELPYSHVGLVSGYSDYLRFLPSYRTRILVFSAIAGRYLGLILAGIVCRLGRLFSGEHLIPLTELLEAYCLKALEDKQLSKVCWVIFGWTPSKEELLSTWRAIKEFSLSGEI